MAGNKKEAWQARAAIFLISQCITLFGSTLVQMAVVWYATMETASGAWVAAFTVCAYVPQFLFSLPGGAWADRYSRKALIIGADAAIAAVTLAMVFMLPLYTAQRARLVALLGMSTLRAIGAGIQTPAVNAVLPGLIPPKQRMRYNGINAAMQAAVQFAAPAVAAAVFSLGTLASTLLIDVATAAVGIALFAPMRLPQPIPGSSSAPAGIKAGIRYALKNRRIARWLLLHGLFTFLCVPAGFLSGLFVRRTFGDTYWHLTAAEVAGFAGMAAGGAAMSCLGKRAGGAAVLPYALAAFGTFAVAMAAAQGFALYIALMFGYGAALSAAQASLTTLLQQEAEESMQGRVFGLAGALYAAFLPAGMAAFGPLCDAVPLRALMAFSGGALFLLAAFAFAAARLPSCRPGQ